MKAEIKVEKTSESMGTSGDPEIQRGSTMPNSSFSELSIHLYLYTLIKKRDFCFSTDNQIDFIKEEAPILSVMLENQGFIQDISDEPGCVVCATEKLEKDLMDLMKQQLEITKMASSFYTKPENEKTYNICANHRPFNPKNCVPNASAANPTVGEDFYFAAGNANNAHAQSSSSAQDQNQEEAGNCFLGITHSRSAKATAAYLNGLGIQMPDDSISPFERIVQKSLPRLTVTSTSTFDQTLAQNIDNLLENRAQNSAANYMPANYTITQDYLRNIESVNKYTSENNLQDYFTANQPVPQDSTAGYLNNYSAQNYASNFKPKYINQESGFNYTSGNHTGAQKAIAQDYIPMNFTVAPNNSPTYLPANHTMTQDQEFQDTGSYYMPENYMTSRGTVTHYVPPQDCSLNYKPNHLIAQESSSMYVPNQGQESFPYYAANSNIAQNYLVNNSVNQTLAARANGTYFPNHTTPTYNPNRTFVPNVAQANNRSTNSASSSSDNIYDVGNNLLNLCIQPANPDPRDTRASPSVSPNILHNHIFTQTLNANPVRRAYFNRAVNNVVNEVQEQMRQYPGRKILGKKY